MRAEDDGRVDRILICLLTIVAFNPILVCNAQHPLDQEKVERFRKFNGSNLPFHPEKGLERIAVNRDLKRGAKSNQGLIEVKLRAFIPSPIVGLGIEDRGPRVFPR